MRPLVFLLGCFALVVLTACNIQQQSDQQQADLESTLFPPDGAETAACMPAPLDADANVLNVDDAVIGTIQTPVALFQAVDNAQIIKTLETELEGSACSLASLSPQDLSFCLETVAGNGQIAISPAQVAEANCVGVDAGIVTVTWADAPPNFAMVEFWTRSASGNTDVIGTDNDPSDGASIEWRIDQSQPPVVVYAFPYVEGGAGQSSELALYIRP